MKVTIEGHRKDKQKHANLEEIVVEERFRENFGNLDELMESIKEKGIIQPITVDSEMRLLAGGRRYECAKRLGLPTIPVIIRPFIDELDSREIELIENIHRKDFDWHERARITDRIHKLYEQKHSKTEDWSGRKTAQLVDRSVQSVANDLKLAAMMEILPELANSKTADDALKFVKKFEEDAIVAELRKRQQGVQDAPEETSHSAGVATRQLESGLRSMLRMADQNYIISDVFKGLSGLKSNGNINIIECDPPYGIDLNSQKGSKESVTSNVHSYNEIHSDNYPSFLANLCTELYRVASKDCWCIFWYGPSWHQVVLDSLRSAGWHVDEIPAIWTKEQGQTMQPEIYFARGYEPFFICRKGKPVMVERGHLNVFPFKGVPGAKKYHPTQRPIELIIEIFNCLAAGRANVLVPFLGSGATLLACYAMGFTGFGFDLNGEYKDKFMLAVEDQTRKLFSNAEQD